MSSATFPERLRRSPLLRVAGIGALVLALQIPIASIQGVLSERQSTRGEAVEEVAGRWGGAQSIAGLYLLIPYRVVEVDTVDGQTRTREVTYTATFLPRRLAIDLTLETENRYRGIFEIPVYRSRLALQGEFARPDFTSWSISPDILWDRAHLAIAISDPRSVQDGARLTWSGRELELAAGLGGELDGAGLHATIGKLGADASEFSLALELNGSAQLRVAPLGRTTSVAIRGDWPEPSFSGAWLPLERRVDQRGFEAHWRIPHLARDYPERWASGERSKAVERSLFGVDLLAPVDTYRTIQRSLKYQLLFLGLTFVGIWLFEVRIGLRVHPIQYALIGAALCLFYLLELSLAEHIGFALAYALAASGVVLLVTAYASAVLRSPARAALLGGGTAALYAYLYVLLQIQDFALVVGSVGLFAILALVMWATRSIDWYDLRLGDHREPEAP